MRFFIEMHEMHEQNHRLPMGRPDGYSTLKEAKADAIRFVDDAMPNNIVSIMLTVTSAYLGGDGGSYFADEKDE